MFHQLFLSLRFVFADMRSAKARTALTILGIVIGIAATIIVMAVGRSAQELVLDQVRSIGSNIVVVIPGNADDDGLPAATLGIVTKTLVPGDLDALQNSIVVPHMKAVTGYVRSQVTVQQADVVRMIQLEGVSHTYTEIENATIAHGRFLSPDDGARRTKNVVLGATAAQELFGGADPLEQTLKINNHRFRVIGVIEKRGASFISNPDTTIFIPLTSAQQLLNRTYFDFIRLSVDTKKNVERTQEDVRVLLRARHNITDVANDDFSVRSTESALSILTNVTDILTFFLVGVAAVSLLVGGIGVMNIMFIAASRRVREIGLRKSLGARSSDIFVQFVSESVILSLFGGLIGFLVGVVVTVVAWGIAQALGYNWQFIIPLDAVVVSFVVVFAIGVVFGSYPARRAARISPIEALRYE